MDASIKNACDELVKGLNIIMNPLADQKERLIQYKLCEEFKESSPICAQCGLFLSSRGNFPIVRHLGLQLIEHCVKFRWNVMSAEEKLFIKDNSLILLASGAEHILTEKPHIKDALSRIIVEMIKREWPQQWPSLLQELNEICSVGETQIELVLLIFLRLAEDIVTFQNIQNQRRREIHQALTSNLGDLFSFFLKTLNTQYDKCIHLKIDEEQHKHQILIHSRVAETVLKTLAGYVEWVPMSYITANDSMLLKNLCLLLGDNVLRLSSAECLLLIVSRKGKMEERKPLLVLFSEAAMTVIFSSASSVAKLPLADDHYLFLKKLCQVLTSLGTQLSALWGTIKGIGPPATFATYLRSILSFTEHPSHVLSGYTQSLWLAFFRHPQISQNPSFQAIIPEVINSTKPKLMKIGYPSRSDSLSCEYSRLDFDSDEEFSNFYSKFRQDVTDVLKQATIINSEVVFNFGAQWLQAQLNQPIDIGENAENGLCNLMSPSYVQWDALAQYLESVTSRLSSDDKAKPLIEKGIKLLEMVLNFKIQDPFVLSCILSCISALFVFLTFSPEMLPSVLDKIFSAVTYSLPGQTKATRSKAVKNVRRHACSSVVKLCKKHTKLILPAFDQMCNHVKNLGADPQQLSMMEKCTLQEALILISNEFLDYNRQSAYLKEILIPISEIWLSEEIKQAFSSTENFMAYIGLDQAPIEPGGNDVKGIIRSQIVYCVSMIMGILKRSKWPSDFEEVKKGGFLCPHSENSFMPHCRNPTTPHIVPLLEGIFSLIRVLNSLFVPSVKSKIHSDFACALDMLETDKNNILGCCSPPVDITESQIFRQPSESMKYFLANVHENCFHILGSSAQSLGCEFYAIPDLSTYISTCVFSCLKELPDYRLRFFVRSFIKIFLQSCPSFHYNVIIPTLELMCPFMYQKLSERWKKFKIQYGTSVGYEEKMTEAQEVLEDQLNRQLTREYIDLLGSIMLNRKGDSNPDAMEDDTEDHSNSHSDALTELGVKLMQSEGILPSLICTVFSSIHWLDTVASLKGLQLSVPIFKQLMANKACRQEEANFLMYNTLLGLQELGEHDANQSLLIGLGLMIYENTKQIFPGISEMLMQFSGCQLSDIENFDGKLFGPVKQNSEKKKRESFKKLISEIIGQNVGQRFKRDVKIKNLPPLSKRSRPKNQSLDETEERDMGLCVLFGASVTAEIYRSQADNMGFMV